MHNLHFSGLGSHVVAVEIPTHSKDFPLILFLHKYLKLT